MLKAAPLLLILLCVSCGKEAAQGQRCYTREEAMRACEAREMLENNLPLQTATLVCEPFYPAQACYYL